ncbi:MAG: PEP-CTERM sorting domain-containing protein [Phycisphaeraceae bacterium]|nr:PEP-CTERM sorting domain-containing protein [Phycisphaeraceae bacterium]
MSRFLAIACAMGCSASVLGAEAFSNATVQPGGPRPPTSGEAFFNIEGNANGNFASWGAARFDMTADKAALDALYGVNNWVVTGARLKLTQSNAAFSTAGDVSVFFSSNNSTSFDSGTSPLRFNAGFLPGGNSQGADGLVREATALVTYTYTPIASGTIDTYNLILSPGLLSRLMAGSASNIVTLTFEGQSDTVAATYAGFSNFTYDGPVLEIIAEQVPAPGSLALLGLSGLIAGRRRR